MTATRLEALRDTMRSGRVDALLLTHLPHVRYLTGFSGSNAACLVTQRSVWFATDPRYATQVEDEVSDARLVVAQGPLPNMLLRKARLSTTARIGFQRFRMSVGAFDQLRAVRPKARWSGIDPILETIASIKSDEEAEAIRHAAAISDAVFADMLGWIKPGMRESEIAAEISYRQRGYGADGDAFEPIVASGLRGALPHAGATHKRVRKGELVTLDFGCTVSGFCSDITRTIAIGKVSRRLRSVYQAVLAAQLTALSAVRAGVPGRAVDAEARRVLAAAKMERWFRHSLGHGLGLEVHESPRLAPRSRDTLEEGQVVTVEPGVYIPGTGGVRIEDDVLVTGSGIELLTSSPKELISL